MKGKHIRKEKKSIVWILIALFVLIGVIFGCFHFKSIAGAIDSNKGLIKGNRIYIYYEGTLDIKNKDIQSIKVKSYKVLE